jgi:hypothetical protein
MDIRDTELSMYHGNNGDYYICLKETKRGEIVKLDTRIAMSGGNATSEIRQAVSSLFKALLGQNSDMGERQSNIPDVSGSVCYSSACSNNEDNKCKHGDYDCSARQTMKRIYQT